MRVDKSERLKYNRDMPSGINHLLRTKTAVAVPVARKAWLSFLR